MAAQSKLDFAGERVDVSGDEARHEIIAILTALGVSADHAQQTAEHLVEASLCGVESHGVMRILQYAEQYQAGYLHADATPTVSVSARGALSCDGDGGIGIPAANLAFDRLIDGARDCGIAAMAMRNLGHTGRHGAYVERAAEVGLLTIMLGGGNRTTWRQVAPYGGARALLPTNPYSIGIPGGERGPVVLDFATSKIAGGWIYAAKNAGARLPEGCVIDRDGHPTTDPEDYFNGGAILPAGEQKGYALALVAELIADAMLGPATTECHWLAIALDTTLYSDGNGLSARAEEILAEIRACPPTDGFARVEVPGERERARKVQSDGRIQIPEKTWSDILDLGRTLHDGA